jgi:hypothetical protein
VNATRDLTDDPSYEGERMLGDLTAGPAASTACPRCGTAGMPGDRFCGGCGLARGTATPRRASPQSDPDTVAIPRQRLTPPPAAPRPLPQGVHALGPLPPGAVAGVAPEPFVMPAWARTIPPLIWAGIAVAVVVFVVGFGMFSSSSAMAESCTIGSAGRWSLVEDTPACDAALSDQELGRNLMILGAVAAIGLPVRAAARRKPSAPSSAHPAGGPR